MRAVVRARNFVFNACLSFVVSVITSGILRW